MHFHLFYVTRATCPQQEHSNVALSGATMSAFGIALFLHKERQREAEREAEREKEREREAEEEGEKRREGEINILCFCSKLVGFLCV